jgi:hypothetical protein
MCIDSLRVHVVSSPFLPLASIMIEEREMLQDPINKFIWRTGSTLHCYADSSLQTVRVATPQDLVQWAGPHGLKLQVSFRLKEGRDLTFIGYMARPALSNQAAIAATSAAAGGM